VILEFKKVHHHARTPDRAHPSDAGLDVFYSPHGDEPHPGRHVLPGESVILGTGLKFGVPHGYMLEVKNRSGNAAKKSLLVGACVIDSGYDGEVFINLHNVGKLPQWIAPGMKVAQVVLTPVVHFRAAECTEGDLYDYPMTISSRGQGALGSTG
tara:strand:+ start:5187 stop:5648 length:462 start_codon:yes stop_codon:yes gene_type:complete